MKRATGLASMVMAAGAASTAALADEGSWLVRARAVRLHMADQSEAIPSVGVPSLRVGVDVKVTDNLFVNLDVKKVWISSDVMLKSTGAKVSSVTLDPIAFSVGIGYRF